MNHENGVAEQQQSIEAMNLSHLADLSPELAKRIVDAYAPEGTRVLDFQALESISVEAAEELAKYPGELYLSSIRTLTSELAEALSRHTGVLVLNRVENLTPEVARILVRHEGYVGFGTTTEQTVFEREGGNDYGKNIAPQLHG